LEGGIGTRLYKGCQRGNEEVKKLKEGNWGGAGGGLGMVNRRAWAGLGVLIRWDRLKKNRGRSIGRGMKSMGV